MALEQPRFPDRFDWQNVKGELESFVFKLLNGQMMCPPGAMVCFADTTPPDGWVEAAGQEFEITKYPDLYQAIGDRYGGTATTFNVPNAGTAPEGEIWIIKV